MGAQGEDGVRISLSLLYPSVEQFLIWLLYSVYGVLRAELWGEAIEKFQRISYVHNREVSRAAKVKI